MSDKPPALHAANCRVDDCDWSTLATSMVALYGDLEDHLKDDHGYSEEEWRDARERLTREREGTRQTKLTEAT